MIIIAFELFIQILFISASVKMFRKGNNTLGFLLLIPITVLAIGIISAVAGRGKEENPELE